MFPEDSRQELGKARRSHSFGRFRVKDVLLSTHGALPKAVKAPETEKGRKYKTLGPRDTG
jgi:hypothetical protein